MAGSGVAAVDSIFTQVIGRTNKKSRKGKTAQPNDITATTAISTGNANITTAVCAGNTASTTAVNTTLCFTPGCSCSDCCNCAEIIESLRVELEHTKTELDRMKVQVKQLTSHVHSTQALASYLQTTS